MIDFIKKNIFIALIFFITLFVGFLTFLTFIDKSFVELNEKNEERIVSMHPIEFLSKSYNL